MPVVNRIKQAIDQNSLLRRIYGKSKLIVEIYPYYLVEEGLSDNKEQDFKPGLDKFTVGFLGTADMQTIAASPEEDSSEDILLERLANDWLCLGLKYHDHIAAYMWCNLRECSSNLLPFQLEKHEAYLTYAYTFKAYRGKNLAPHLRYQLYVYLAQIGRTKLYSITKATSTPARRFKEKLKAKPLKFYLHVKFFKRLRWNILLKDYTRLQL
jgi:ribosomal protein S18 acetylase RimI-like enzyme